LIPRLILASGSAVRARLLTNAGLAFEVIPSTVDEDDIKQAHGDASVEDLAMILARAKAADVAARHPDALTIGADQILECGGKRFDKPKDRAEAASHLRAFRGRTHRLITACTIYRGAEEIWRHTTIPQLVMWAFDDAFIDAYLTRAGDGVLTSVGAYQLEGLGAHLFERIEGDYFSILGLPVLPLLSVLRLKGLLLQ
jgi:septum formation protein